MILKCDSLEINRLLKLHNIPTYYILKKIEDSLKLV